MLNAEVHRSGPEEIENFKKAVLGKITFIQNRFGIERTVCMVSSRVYMRTYIHTPTF